MDHAQLTSADFAHINAGKALEEARETSRKIDALAALLGYTPEDLLLKGKELEDERSRKKKEEEEATRLKREAEFLASGLTKEEFNSKKLREMNIRNMKRMFEPDPEESAQFTGYTFNYATGMLDKMLGVKNDI